VIRRFDSNGCQINDKCRRYSWAGRRLHAVGDSSALSLHREQEVTFISSTLPGTDPTFTTGYAAAFHKQCSTGPWLLRTRGYEDVRIRMGGFEDVTGRRCTEYCAGGKIKKTEMSGACGTYGGRERGAQGSGGET